MTVVSALAGDALSATIVVYGEKENRPMISQAEEVLARVKLALDMLPHVLDVPITDAEIVEVAEQAPPGPQLHSAFVAREFVLEHQAWLLLGDSGTAEAALRPLAQSHGCTLHFTGATFVFVKQRDSAAPAETARPAESAVVAMSPAKRKV
jgi:hypothetical protein